MIKSKDIFKISLVATMGICTGKALYSVICVGLDKIVFKSVSSLANKGNESAKEFINDHYKNKREEIENVSYNKIGF